MLNSVEKAVMFLLYDKCASKESVLISPNQIIIPLIPKFELSQKELDKIINNLIVDGYIDVINSDNKGNPIYCVSLKMKGIAFKRDMLNQRKNNRYLIARTVALAILSVTVTLILRAIFS